MNIETIFLYGFFVIFGIIAYVISFATIKLMRHLGVVDDPRKAPERKQQKVPVPLNGIAGVYFIILMCISLLSLEVVFNVVGYQALLESGLFLSYNMFWIVCGSFLLALLGILDDIYNLKPYVYFPGVIFSLIVIVFAGNLKIEAFSYPFDVISFESMWFISRAFAFVWLLCCVSATKFLDGMDGLVTSIGMISFFAIAFTSSLTNVSQPLIFLISCLWILGLGGFLPFNLPNARAYLGEAGATSIGLWIGILSILSGAKVATAFSVVGWFIIDIICVIIFRLYRYGFRFSSIVKADAFSHWHHRLLNSGLSKLQALVLTIVIVSVSAFAGVLLPTEYKLLVFIAQISIITLSFVMLIKKSS